MIADQPLRIVILDAHTANPGDLDWSPLEKYGQLTVYDRTASDLTVSRAMDADIVFTNKTIIDDQVLAQLPRLKFIGVLATGVNVVDLTKASELGITVCNCPAYSTDSVAQHVIAMMLAITNHIESDAMANRQGLWPNAEDFAVTTAPLTELAGLTLGLIGIGAIGSRVADIARALGMSIIYTARTSKYEHGTQVDLNTLLATSDVISLHCPLTEETKHLINAESLKKMKSTAILINTARGPVINEQDLYEALNEEIIAAAIVDVLSQEPPAADNALLSHPKCLITGHVAWMTQSARARLLQITFNNLQAFLDGTPINQVN